MTIRIRLRLLFPYATVAILIFLTITAVRADSTWSVGRPTSTTSYDYRNGSGGPVKLSNAYLGSDAQSSIGIEVYRYSYNYLGNPTTQPFNDQYTLRIEAAGSTRVAHKYIINSYGTSSYNADCSKWAFCVASGITQSNTGAWINLQTAFYYGGRPYTQIFVCANGWAAFVYNGTSNCGGYPQTIPQHNSVDVSGWHGVPEGILSPLWKTMDLKLSDTTKIQVGYSYDPSTWGRRCVDTVGGCGWSIIWKNVATAGAYNCYGAPCLQTFSIVFYAIGVIQFEYAGVDKVTGSEIVGLDDPSGYGSTIADRNQALCGSSTCTHAPGNRQVTFQDASAVNTNSPWINFLSNGKLIMSSPDSSTAYFVNNDPYTPTVQGYNIRTTNPPPPTDYARLLADFADQGLVESICREGIGLCIVGHAGDFVANQVCVQYLVDRCIYSLVKKLLPQPSVPQFVISPWSGGQTYVQAPVEENDLWCGPILTKSCGTDAGMYAVAQWIVPHDGTSHNIQVSFQIQTGGKLDGSGGAWETTSVNLTVAPEGDFGLSSTCSSVSLPINTYYTGCQLTMSPGTGFYGSVSLTHSDPISGTFPDLTNPPSGGAFQLSAPMPITTPFAIQTGGIPGVYTVSLTANSGIRTHTLSIVVTVNDPSDFTISASPNTLVVSQGWSAYSTITVTGKNGFSGNVALGTSVPGSFSPTFSPTTVYVPVGSSASANLQITPGCVPPGTYGYSVTGTSISPSITRSGLFTIAVNPDNTQCFNVNNVQTFSGVRVTTFGSSSISTTTTSGTISVSAVDASTGSTLFYKSYSITEIMKQQTPTSPYQALLLLNIPIAPYVLGSFLTLTLSGSTASTSTMVVRSADIDQNGMVNIIDFGILAASFGAVIGQPGYNPRADLDGNGAVDIIDAGIMGNYFGCTNYM
ncbi:MAG TPA: dockerin type I domain-containing protein [Candidatus Bathyarchaeia archaeon]|nr:dockerin type I domain-containing protein [Candidatus Bathyarchaeia archaeon]